MSKPDSGVVNIHGREYKTVALRVQEFRESFHINDGWAITTELVSATDTHVVMVARIVDAEGRTVATGHAEERRAASQINRTSALENCETSAIGRALAAAGFGGSEYASANEVENAIHQQSSQLADKVAQDRVRPEIQMSKSRKEVEAVYHEVVGLIQQGVYSPQMAPWAQDQCRLKCEAEGWPKE